MFNKSIGSIRSPSSPSSESDCKMSTGLELRKANKPLMEKRRRARINKSLNELKTILIESTKKATPGHSKWEKADILEMTVSYLHCLRNQQKATRTDPLAVGQFIAGFSECVRQIQKFNSSETTLDRQTHQKLNEHLLTCLKTFSDDATRGLQHSPTTDSSHVTSPRSSMTPPSAAPSPVGSACSDEDSNITCNDIHPQNLRTLNTPQVTTFDADDGFDYQSEMRRHISQTCSKDVWRPW